MPAVKAAGAFAGNISNGVPIAGATAPVRELSELTAPIVVP